MNYPSVLLQILQSNPGSTLSYLSGPQCYQLNLHIEFSKYTIFEVLNHSSNYSKHTVIFKILDSKQEKIVNVKLVLPRSCIYTPDTKYIVDRITKIKICKVCFDK